MLPHSSFIPLLPMATIPALHDSPQTLLFPPARSDQSVLTLLTLPNPKRQSSHHMYKCTNNLECRMRCEVGLQKIDGSAAHFQMLPVKSPPLGSGPPLPLIDRQIRLVELQHNQVAGGDVDRADVACPGADLMLLHDDVGVELVAERLPLLVARYMTCA